MDERQFLLSLDLSGSNENIVVPDINATSLSRQKYVIFYFVKDNQRPLSSCTIGPNSKIPPNNSFEKKSRQIGGTYIPEPFIYKALIHTF